MESDIKQEILDIFNKYRQSSDADFKEENFLDHLIPQPKVSGAFRNSFKGLRGYNKFLDEVQYEFGICFSIKDRETNYSLDNFSQRVIQLMKSKRSSLASLRNQMKQPFELNIFLTLNLVGLVSITLLWQFKIVAFVLIAMLFVINVKLIHFYLKEHSYLKKLEQKISSRS